MTDPFLAKVSLRAWGTDDPRVLKHLWPENDRARTVRTEAVGERARAVGWPSAGWERSREQATAAMQRLEGGDFTLRGRQRRHRERQAVAYESRRGEMVATVRGGVLPAEEPDVGGYDHDNGPSTIFDE